MTRRHDPAGPRAAMIRSTVELMRRRGVAAVSFADVLADSGAPRGSVYHHFPGGRSQLVEEATRSAAGHLSAAVARILDASDTPGALHAMADLWRRGLEAGDYAVGCPIVAAALGTERAARDVAGEVFGAWCDLISDRLVADGADRRRAQSLAVLVVGALEGALVLAQAQRTSAPLDAVVDELSTLCRSVIGTTPQAR
ncbi:TetR/AcrR family transcriptional regulator [Planomonospora venezuelensis]|uniref:AcrR family transcriptional regulator n=1 Tax=Planomonospora venezuelensis TaxID=1999 RepID=A0A841DA73_PLAVE|nr:TetR/AcrR family transcriptional regulator [Planomonospora venezuelensis]MBB5967081.1 AcrR family transcriptional regulator [Planomonospora venezuelensis]GIN04921.1 TetR family transcriptional regulator [Planomonospora venezuelensis]